MSLPLPLPDSRAHIAQIQSERKKKAFALAKTVPWYRDKLGGIDEDALDDPDRMAKDFRSSTRIRCGNSPMRSCSKRSAPFRAIRSRNIGARAARPASRCFIRVRADDLRYGELSWGRSFPCIGIGRGDLCHISFPLGVHPAGQVWARSAKMFGVGMVWVGAGNSYPSAAQLDLIHTLRPTVFIGMSSFALHLANLAEAKGINLAAGSVRKLVCSAETLSAAKREKLSRLWGAEVFDVFGMSEAGLMGAENSAHDGIHIWTDMYFIEVVDPDTGHALPEGKVGTLCVTPLWTNHATPFLRWNSGDLVSFASRSAGTGRFAELFPVIKHANRTTGFFKVRGVNVNHAEFEDMMFRNADVLDFQAVLETEAKTDRENLRVLIEIKGSCELQTVCAAVAETVKNSFEISPSVEVLERGSLAAEFERSLKAPRS